ncbi:MAG: CHASE2 domain-containing protein [Kofleriaceae bacterium]
MAKALEKARNVWVRDARTRGAAITFVTAFVAAWLLSLLGLGGAIDNVALRSYYAVRGARESVPLLFVAIDEQTVQAWGPPPWKWSQYEQLIRPMRAGGAKLIALVEPGPRVVVNEPVPDDLASGVGAGWLIVPTGNFAFQQPAVSLTTTGVVDAIDLGDPDGQSITRDLITRLGFETHARTLPVNFIGSPDRLPTIPAHHVARGELPPSTFSNRVIVIGVRGERFTTSLPTPVGPMSPSEIHAHAVHSLLAHDQLGDVPGWAQLASLGLVTIIGVFVLRRTRKVWMLVGSTVATGLVLYLVGYLLFRYADLEFSIGTPALALVTGALAGLILERKDALRGVDELRRQVKNRLRLGSTTIRAGATEEEILDRFADTLKTLLPSTSLLWASLPPGAWHLKLTRWYEGSDADVFEQRRDVRRDPWRLPYGSHKPEWSNRPFLREHLNQKSLLIPIAAFGRLLGFWIVNMPALRQVPADQLRVLEPYADDVAIAISQHRLQWKAADVKQMSDGMAGALFDAVSAARHDTATLAHVQDRTRATLEYLPIGVLSATTWGMVEHCNGAMLKFLALMAIESPERAGIAALIAELAGTSVVGAREMLREVAVAGKSVHFVVTVAEPGADDTASQTRYDLVLSRVEVGEPTPGERVPSALVLTAAARPADKPSRSGSGSDDERMGQVVQFQNARKPSSD